MPKLEVVNANNVIEFNPQKANFKLKNTGGPKGETGAQGPKGDTGPQGLQGPAGASASVTVGSTTTLSPGADATVTNSGDTRNAILNFGIPTGARGPKGDTGSKGDTGPMGPKGAKGDTGAAATVQVGNTNTGAPGTNAQVTNAGNEHFAVFNFTIPRGDKGEKGATGAQGPKGDKGDKGDAGTAATITVGSTTTTNPGTNATVTNSGTTSAAVLNFGIPKGATGSVKSEVVSELPETGEGDTFYLVNREATEQTATGKTISFENSDNAGDITDFQLDGETSQNGTPTPSAPVAVQTVTGENAVKICGKNLFNKDNYDSLNAYVNGSTITASANNVLVWIPCQPSTSYAITVVGSNVTTSIYSAPNIPVVGGTANWLGSIAAGDTTGVFTTKPEAKYIVVRIWTNTSSQTVQEALDALQIELGSTATDFEPYQGQSYEVNLGDIELCKIGTYQDYIYKSGDKWYVRKEIGKYVYNNDLTSNGISSTRVDMLTPVLPIAPNVSSLVGVAVSNMYGAQIANNSGLSGTTAVSCIRVNTSIDIADSYNAVKALAAANNLTIYYALATPTDTEITNEALVAQLDNVASAPLYTGVNNITTITSNEQGTLEIKYVTYDKYNQNKVYIWNDTLQQWQIIVP